MKLRLLSLVLLCSAGVMAQNPYIAPQGVVQSEGGIVVSQPRTVLAVDITAQREVILCGPYARYAQKFLGVRAPLTDKTTWTVAKAAVSLVEGLEALEVTAPNAATSRVLSHAVAKEEFARLQPDKLSMTVPALEDAARDAAMTIFSLRKHRLDLITGEAGENVFGEGLKSALAEIARLEQSYLELFLGKDVLTTETNRYLVYPQSDKQQYVVCRFSPAEGLLPASDLTGDMVLLQTEPSGNTATGIEASQKESSFVVCRVADPTICTVICGGREYTQAVLPIFEFGRTINVALPRRK